MLLANLPARPNDVKCCDTFSIAKNLTSSEQHFFLTPDRKEGVGVPFRHDRRLLSAAGQQGKQVINANW
jgi:hypothetical protein